LKPSVSDAKLPRKKELGWRPVVAIGSVLLLVIVAITAQRIAFDTNQHDNAGHCTLRAIAFVVTPDMPISQATAGGMNVLAIRSLDAAEWSNLEVTVFGFESNGGRKRPTGAYKSKPGAGTTRGNLTVLDLTAFENASGQRWVPLTMSVDDIELKASMRGESCAAEIAPNASPLDVIGR
jgi:hypothetical protein